MKKAQTPRSGNKVDAQPGHTGHKRPLAELRKTDEQVACLPDSCCADCGGEVIANSSVSYRHQVFELPKREQRNLTQRRS